MTTLYLIRHGQTDNNLLCRFNGCASDQLLNEVGMEMAKGLTEAFADVKLDAIYSSPLKRAYMTAEGVRGDRDLKIVTDPDLMEMDFGRWDGMTWSDILRISSVEQKRWLHDIAHFRAPGATEGGREAAARMLRALLRIVREHRGQTVAVASHGFAISACVARMLRVPLSKYRRLYGMHNTGYAIIEIEDDGHFTVKAWNKRDHYHPEALKRPRRRVREFTAWVLKKRHYHPAFRIK